MHEQGHMTPPSNRTLKVILLGDGSVGKTSLRSRYLNDSFQRAYVSTIGADFISKTLEVKVPVPASYKSNATRGKGVNGKQNQPREGEASTSAQTLDNGLQTESVRVTLSIWDTAGQERFKSLGSAFYRGSDAVIIAFDLTKKGSLARTINWYNDFCRLGDVGYEEEGMNSRQLKGAREQKDRFCWVAVGCKGDLLEGLSRKGEESNGDADQDWRGTSWTEARGWFDSMIPRLLPDGEVEKMATQMSIRILRVTRQSLI
jgi:small GTP-binding protein